MHHCRYLNLPPSLQERVKKYFETLWERHRCTDSSNIAGFTKLLSVPLQQELLLALNKDIIKKVLIAIALHECSIN